MSELVHPLPQLSPLWSRNAMNLFFHVQWVMQKSSTAVYAHSAPAPGTVLSSHSDPLCSVAGPPPERDLEMGRPPRTPLRRAGESLQEFRRARFVLDPDNWDFFLSHFFLSPQAAVFRPCIFALSLVTPGGRNGNGDRKKVWMGPLLFFIAIFPPQLACVFA